MSSHGKVIKLEWCDTRKHFQCGDDYQNWQNVASQGLHKDDLVKVLLAQLDRVDESTKVAHYRSFIAIMSYHAFVDPELTKALHEGVSYYDALAVLMFHFINADLKQTEEKDTKNIRAEKESRVLATTLNKVASQIFYLFSHNLDKIPDILIGYVYGDRLDANHLKLVMTVLTKLAALDHAWSCLGYTKYVILCKFLSSKSDAQDVQQAQIEKLVMSLKSPTGYLTYIRGYNDEVYELLSVNEKRIGVTLYTDCDISQLLSVIEAQENETIAKYRVEACKVEAARQTLIADKTSVPNINKVKDTECNRTQMSGEKEVVEEKKRNKRKEKKKSNEASNHSEPADEMDVSSTEPEKQEESPDKKETQSDAPESSTAADILFIDDRTGKITKPLTDVPEITVSDTDEVASPVKTVSKRRSLQVSSQKEVTSQVTSEDSGDESEEQSRIPLRSRVAAKTTAVPVETETNSSRKSSRRKTLDNSKLSSSHISETPDKQRANKRRSLQVSSQQEVTSHSQDVTSENSGDESEEKSRIPLRARVAVKPTSVVSSEDESTQDSVRSKPSPRNRPASNRRSTITPASKQVIEDIIEETTSDTSEIQVEEKTKVGKLTRKSLAALPQSERMRHGSGESEATNTSTYSLRKRKSLQPTTATSGNTLEVRTPRRSKRQSLSVTESSSERKKAK